MANTSAGVPVARIVRDANASMIDKSDRCLFSVADDTVTPQRGFRQMARYRGTPGIEIKGLV